MVRGEVRERGLGIGKGRRSMRRVGRGRRGKRERGSWRRRRRLVGDEPWEQESQK